MVTGVQRKKSLIQQIFKFKKSTSNNSQQQNLNNVIVDPVEQNLIRMNFLDIPHDQ